MQIVIFLSHFVQGLSELSLALTKIVTCIIINLFALFFKRIKVLLKFLEITFEVMDMLDRLRDIRRLYCRRNEWFSIEILEHLRNIEGMSLRLMRVHNGKTFLVSINQCFWVRIFIFLWTLKVMIGFTSFLLKFLFLLAINKLIYSPIRL